MLDSNSLAPNAIDDAPLEIDSPEFNWLSAVQFNVLIGTIKLMYEDIYQSAPLQVAKQAFEAIFQEDKLNIHQEILFNRYDILGSINQAREIYFHPCPQNRNQSYPYLGQRDVPPGYIILKNPKYDKVDNQTRTVDRATSPILNTDVQANRYSTLLDVEFSTSSGQHTIATIHRTPAFLDLNNSEQIDHYSWLEARIRSMQNDIGLTNSHISPVAVQALDNILQNNPRGMDLLNITVPNASGQDFSNLLNEFFEGMLPQQPSSSHSNRMPNPTPANSRRLSRDYNNSLRNVFTDQNEEAIVNQDTTQNPQSIQNNELIEGEPISIEGLLNPLDPYFNVAPGPTLDNENFNVSQYPTTGDTPTEDITSSEEDNFQDNDQESIELDVIHSNLLYVNESADDSSLTEPLLDQNRQNINVLIQQISQSSNDNQSTQILPAQDDTSVDSNTENFEDASSNLEQILYPQQHSNPSSEREFYQTISQEQGTIEGQDEPRAEDIEEQSLYNAMNALEGGATDENVGGSEQSDREGDAENAYESDSENNPPLDPILFPGQQARQSIEDGLTQLQNTYQTTEPTTREIIDSTILENSHAYTDNNQNNEAEVLDEYGYSTGDDEASEPYPEGFFDPVIPQSESIVYIDPNTLTGNEIFILEKQGLLGLTGRENPLNPTPENLRLSVQMTMRQYANHFLTSITARLCENQEQTIKEQTFKIDALNLKAALTKRIRENTNRQYENQLNYYKRLHDSQLVESHRQYTPYSATLNQNQIQVLSRAQSQPDITQSRLNPSPRQYSSASLSQNSSSTLTSLQMLNFQSGRQEGHRMAENIDNFPRIPVFENPNSYQRGIMAGFSERRRTLDHIHRRNLNIF